MSVSFSAFWHERILISEFAVHTSHSTLKQLKGSIKIAWAACITYDGNQSWFTGMFWRGASVIASVVSSHWWYKSKQNPYHSSVCGIGTHLKVAALDFNKTEFEFNDFNPYYSVVVSAVSECKLVILPPPVLYFLAPSWVRIHGLHEQLCTLSIRVHLLSETTAAVWSEAFDLDLEGGKHPEWENKVISFFPQCKIHAEHSEDQRFYCHLKCYELLG